jgi:hypothetical protein
VEVEVEGGVLLHPNTSGLWATGVMERPCAVARGLDFNTTESAGTVVSPLYAKGGPLFEIRDGPRLWANFWHFGLWEKGGGMGKGERDGKGREGGEESEGARGDSQGKRAHLGTGIGSKPPWAFGG